jgi:hypothetical protein
MTKLSVIQRSSALSLVLMLAASSVPATGAPAEDDPSGSITVGVVITEEPDECTDATLTFSSEGDFESAEFVDTSAAETLESLQLWDLVNFAFRDSKNPQEDIMNSFPSTGIGSNFGDELGSSEGTLDVVDDPSNYVYRYSNDPETFPWTHPADLDGDGAIEIDEDTPTYLLEEKSYFHTGNFDVVFDAGVCTSVTQYGLLSVGRDPLQKLFPMGEDVFEWGESEVGQLINREPGTYSGYGDALLSRNDRMGGTLRSDSVLDELGTEFARAPSSGAYGFDYVSLATGGTEEFFAQIEIAGSGSDILGEYQVLFDFDLFVGDADQIFQLDNAIGCDLRWLISEEPCL